MKLQVMTTTCVAALAAVFMFASTGVSEAAKKKAAAPAPQPQLCFMAWQPVCGMKGKVSKTYANACMARNDGAKVVAQGECKPKAAKKAKAKKKK